MVIEIDQDDIYVVAFDGRKFVVGNEDGIGDLAMESLESGSAEGLEAYSAPLSSLDAKQIDPMKINSMVHSRLLSMRQETQSPDGGVPEPSPTQERTVGSVIGELIDYCEKNKRPKSIEYRASLIEEALELDPDMTYGDLGDHLGVSRSTITHGWIEPARWDINVDGHSTDALRAIGDSLGRDSDGEAALSLVDRYDVKGTDARYAARNSDSLGGFKDRLADRGYDLGSEQFR